MLLYLMNSESHSGQGLQESSLQLTGKKVRTISKK